MPKTKKAMTAVTPEKIKSEIDKLTTQLGKSYESQINKTKKAIERFKSQVIKADQKKKTAKDKRVAATKKVKSKRTGAGQNQLDRAIEAYEIACEDILFIKEDLQAAKDELTWLQQESNYFREEQKALVRFDKEWHKKQKAAQTNKKHATTKSRKKTSEAVKTKTPLQEEWMSVNEVEDYVATPTDEPVVAKVTDQVVSIVEEESLVDD